MTIEEQIKENSTIVENELKRLFHHKNGYGLVDILTYSVLNAGKRVRPFLAIESYKIFSRSKDISAVLPFALAVELVHTYSLIHDDMPCMDNDDYRRGKLTSHKVFGEGKALLAGDSLLTYAFEVLASNEKASDRSIVLATKSLSFLAGFEGMAGGQMIDLDSQDNIDSLEKLFTMHKLKTSCLIQSALELGYYAYTDEPSEDVLRKIKKISDNIGLAFQIKDDILDVTSTKEELGKEIGSDEKNGKKTTLDFMSLEKAQTLVESLTNEAVSLLESFTNGQENTLSTYAKWLVSRKK